MAMSPQEKERKRIETATAKLIKLGYPERSARAIAEAGGHGNKRDPRPKKKDKPKYTVVAGRVVKG